MNKENLANGLLASPVSTGATSATLQSGYGATMPAVPFKLTVTPFGQLSTKGNSEIWLVTARSGEVLTITRAQEGTTAKSFIAGDIVSNGIYVGDMMGSGSFVFKETPTGAVDGSNTSFTTSAPYVGGSLQVYVNGLPQFDYLTEVTPGSGTFTLQDAPDTGDQVRVSYQQLITTFGNSDTVDGLHANATATPGNLVPLNNNGKYPITLIDNPYRFRAYRTAGATSANATNSKLPINVIDFDPNGNFSTANNRYTAAVSGTYQVNARFSVASSSIVAFIMLYKNGVEVRRGGLAKANAEYNGLVLSDLIQLAAGDYIEAWYYVAGALGFETGDKQMYFSGYLVNANEVGA